MVDAASASAVRRVIVIDVPPGDVLLLLIVRSQAQKAISLTGLFNGTNRARRGQAPICGLQRNGKERDRGRVRRCPWRLVGGLGLEEDAPVAARRRA
jgi:hypothetical protein